jgi:hypothetical protein
MACVGWRAGKHRRAVGRCAGCTPTPYPSGARARAPGLTKAGNRPGRWMPTEWAGRGRRVQPERALRVWWRARFGAGGKRWRRIGLVAVARQGLMALWRFRATGVVPAGAVRPAGAPQGRCSVTPRPWGWWRRPVAFPGLRRTPSARWGRLRWAFQPSSPDVERIGGRGPAPARRAGRWRPGSPRQWKPPDRSGRWDSAAPARQHASGSESVHTSRRAMCHDIEHKASSRRAQAGPAHASAALCPPAPPSRRPRALPSGGAHCGALPGAGWGKKLLVEVENALGGQHAHLGSGACSASQAHADPHAGSARTGQRPLTPQRIARGGATRPGARDAGASGATPRRGPPLTAYDLSPPQAPSQQVTAHAGGGTGSGDSWRSRGIETRLTGVRARTESQACEMRGAHTVGRPQSNRGLVPQRVQNGGKNIRKEA